MESDVKIFTYQGRVIRVIKDLAGDPWWAGKDICTYFGSKDYKHCLSVLAEDEKMMVSIKDSGGRVQNVDVVNERGLYMLLLGFLPEHANLDESTESETHLIECIKKIVNFRSWIKKEIFPAILGVDVCSMATPKTNSDATKLLLKEIDKRKEAEKQLAVAAAKKEFLDSVANSSVANVPAEWVGTASVDTPSGVQEIATLSEHGLYYFAARSGTPQALPFLKWISREVLPRLRKMGGYSMAAPKTSPDALRTSADEVERREQAMKQFSLAAPKKGSPVLLH